MTDTGTSRSLYVFYQLCSKTLTLSGTCAWTSCTPSPCPVPRADDQTSLTRPPQACRHLAIRSASASSAPPRLRHARRRRLPPREPGPRRSRSRAVYDGGAGICLTIRSDRCTTTPWLHQIRTCGSPSGRVFEEVLSNVSIVARAKGKSDFHSRNFQPSSAPGPSDCHTC